MFILMYFLLSNVSVMALKGERAVIVAVRIEQTEYRSFSLDIPTGSFVILRTKLFTDSKTWQ